jgi:hypothetical protein
MKPAIAGTDSCQVFEGSVGRKGPGEALRSLDKCLDVYFAIPLCALRPVRLAFSVHLVAKSLFLQSGYSADPWTQMND